MFFKLALLFIVMPAVELFLLIRLGKAIGAPGTILVIVITGFLGAGLAKREGLRALERIQWALNRGEMPARELMDAFLILAAGLVLITPGLITDAAGFLLLVPHFRAWVRLVLVRHFKRRLHIVATGPFERPRPPRDPGVIETTARVIDEEEE